MHSPARAHFIKHSTAAAAKASADSAPRPDLTQYELHLAQLAEHRRRLHQIKSVERKIAFKQQVLPEYGPYIAGVLEGDSGAPDDVLTTVMVWCIDAGDIDGAIEIADYVLRHKLALPDQYKRDAACVIAEEIAEHALRALTAGNADTAALAVQLDRVSLLTADRDMPDEVRAKLHKALGYALRDSEPVAALAELQRAMQLHEKCGVKKDIERLERDIKNTTSRETPPPAGNSPPGGAGATRNKHKKAGKHSGPT